MSFPSPVAFTSWAFNKNPDGTPVDKDAVYNMGKAAKRMGAKTIAVQITEGITSDEVDGFAGDLHVVGWAVCDQDTSYHVSRLGLDGFMPQIEGHGQYESAYATLTALHGTIPVSIVSDYGGLDSKERCDALRKLGATTIYVEAYASSGPTHADLPHYVTDLAAPYGYTADQAIPVMGTFRNETPANYVNPERYAANFGIYLIEPMTGEQLDAFAQLAATIPPPQPNPPTPANGGAAGTVPAAPKDVDCRATVRFAAQTWEAQQTSYQARARLVAARRICDDTNTNDRWTSIRDQVVALLDQAGIAK